MNKMNLFSLLSIRKIVIGTLAFVMLTGATHGVAASRSVHKIKARAKVLILKTVKDGDKNAKDFSKDKENSEEESQKPLILASQTSQIKNLSDRTEVKKYIKQYANSRSSLIKTTVQAKSHLNYISEQVEKRKLPRELALLPMLESNYQQNAVSHAGAVGLWQFMPATGKQYGLKQTAGSDERKDVKASTKAALTYLEYLHKKFNRDWALALAAYNAGEGTVERAIKKNKSAGKATNFWSLKLPKETQAYVPKFVALNHILNTKTK